MRMRSHSQWVFLLLVLMLGFLSSCSPQSNSSKDNNDSVQDINRQWLEQTQMAITIPADKEGEAVLTRNFYFIMDGSGSMRERTSGNCGGDQKFPDKMTGARWAIKTFMTQVPQDVNIGLYVFDRVAKREVVPLGSSNRQQFQQAIDDIDAGGGTPLARAIRIGTDRLVDMYRQQLGYGEFRLVVVTDGKADGIPQAALYAAKYGIPIYTIGLCVGQKHPLRRFSVSYRAADNFADLSQGLQDTLAEIPSFGITEFETGTEELK
jgi:Ca-activated chloride channel homolog